jgi:hypothetical protein
VEVLQRIGEIVIIPTRCVLGRRFVNSCVQHRFPGGELDLPKAMVVPILFSNLCQITMEI